MILVCHVIKGSFEFTGESFSWQVSNLPIGVVIGIVVVEIWCFEWLKGKILHALALISNYCLSLKDMAGKHTAYEINKSDPGHTCLKRESEKKLKITFVSLSKNRDEKEK